MRDTTARGFPRSLEGRVGRGRAQASVTRGDAMVANGGLKGTSEREWQAWVRTAARVGENGLRRRGWRKKKEEPRVESGGHDGKSGGR